MFRGPLGLFQKPPLEGRPNTKPVGDHGTLNVDLFYFNMREDPHE